MLGRSKAADVQALYVFFCGFTDLFAVDLGKWSEFLQIFPFDLHGVKYDIVFNGTI